MKKSLGLMLGTLLVVSACGNEGESDSGNGSSNESGNNEASSGDESGGNDENDSAEASGEAVTLQLGHNLAEDHPVHLGLERFAEVVDEESDGTMEIDIYPNAVLGDEREVLEQVQGGGVDLTKVSASALEGFASQYAVFSLPYVFEDEEHFFEAMNSETTQNLFEETEEQGFIGLTWYDSGARSFYTQDTPIEHPDDLEGMRMRVMDSQTQIDMMEALGGAPTPMPYNEIYTGLQQGVVDGAESNPTALTNGNHGEVAKAFSFDEHARIPDLLVVSADAWNELTDEQQEIMNTASEESTEYQIELWAEAVDEAMVEAEEEMGVEFHYPDKEPFREAVEPMHEEYRQDENIAELMDAFEELR
ncbi:TRAP transporter substrate-binding protein [Alkalicoccus halolimnae]|uniref:TRAP transporter substrate-binding protein n=1 Tax=Alkalicoccus halolimnae TaxID=1667239 RepID=A0A5C7F7D4_9BACI|nr:TRAP transporter substrate-binding protein [Alkalicoccus halolimnae]TXF85480.1 TRAP transporter substrate-binding protein [Alkalicoccus halolimnae]